MIELRWLIILPVLWTFFFMLWGFIRTIQGWNNNFCVKCASFFTTLIVAIAFKFPLIIVALLIGLSATGGAYYLDDFIYKKRGNKEFPLQPMVMQVIFGLAGLLLLFLLDKWYA